MNVKLSTWYVPFKNLIERKYPYNGYELKMKGISKHIHMKYTKIWRENGKYQISEGMHLLRRRKEQVREEKYALLIYVTLYQQTTDQAENMLKKMG